MKQFTITKNDSGQRLNKFLEKAVPLLPRGTAFQQTVWETLRQIPYGQSRSYSQVAAAMGRPTAVRAVAQAIGRNPCNYQ